MSNNTGSSMSLRSETAPAVASTVRGRLRRGLSLAARSAFAASLGCWPSPGFAGVRSTRRPPLGRARAASLPAVDLLGAVAARTAMPPLRVSVGDAGTLLALLAALAAATALRGPGGLPAVVEGAAGSSARCPAGRSISPG